MYPKDFMDLTTFSPKKILVCQLRQIGDVVLTTPVFRMLAQRYPNASIHVMTEDKCLPILENNPDITHIWPIDKNALKPIWKEFAYYKKIAAEGFDLVVDLQRLPRCRWVVFFSKAPVRIANTPHGFFRWLYTHCTPSSGNYASEIKATAMAPLGLRWNGERPAIYLREEEKNEASAYLASLGLRPEHTLVAVDATHRRELRRWPAEYYAQTLAGAAKQYPSLRFQILYAPGEEYIVDEIAAASPSKEHLLPSGNVLSLRKMMACVSQARMLIGNCSAPRHIAVALDVPTLSIQGSTSPSWVFPAPEHGYVSLGLPCQPCSEKGCPNNKACMVELTPDKVLPEFLRRLEGPKSAWITPRAL